MNGKSRSFVVSELKMMTEAIVATRASPLPTLTAADDISAVSWAAAIAGAFVRYAFSLAVVALGAGIGLVSVSLHRVLAATWPGDCHSCSCSATATPFFDLAEVEQMTSLPHAALILLPAVSPSGRKNKGRHPSSHC
jgi:hypothetical protein